MGIFGKERVRLIREKWGSKVDPFAEELFAILGSDEPLEITGPVRITNGTNEPALQIVQSGPFNAVMSFTRSPAQAINLGNIPDVPGFPPIPGLELPAGSPIAFGPNQDAPGSGFQIPEVPGGFNIPAVPPLFGTPAYGIPPIGGVTYFYSDGSRDTWPYGTDPRTQEPGSGTGGGGVPPYGEPEDPRGSSASAGGGGTPGRVVSGTGSSYQVDLYLAGLSKRPTRVSVTQLQIAADAEIPAGTWAVVTKSGSSYFMQVPVWL